MTNDKLREALEQIKANCFRSDITDHTALAGIAIIAKEALASTTVATAVIQGDARGIVEALKPVADMVHAVLSEAPPTAEAWCAFTCCDGYRHSFSMDQLRAAADALAKAPEIIAALPLPTPSAPDAALREALEEAISLLWEHSPGIAPRIERLEAALSNSGQMEKGA